MSRKTQHNADTRKQAEAMIRRGKAPLEIATALGVPRPTVASWKHKMEAKGERVPRLIARGKTVKAPIVPAAAPTVAPQDKAGTLYVREDSTLRGARAFARIKALRSGVLSEAAVVRGLLLVGLAAVEKDRGLLLTAGEG